MYSQSFLKRPGWFLEMPLSHTQTPLHTHPAIWIASVIAGRFRQSTKRARIPPSRVFCRSSTHTRRMNSVKLLWSILSPENGGSFAAPLKSLSVYLAVVFALRSPACSPPEE